MCPHLPLPLKLHNNEIMVAVLHIGAYRNVYVGLREGVGIQEVYRQSPVYKDVILCPEAMIMSLGLCL